MKSNAAHDIFRQRGAEFHFAAQFLTVAKRDAVAATFSFFDLLADAVKGDAIEDRVALVHGLIDAIYAKEVQLPKPQFRDRSQQVLAAFAAASEKFQIPAGVLLDFVESRRMDATVTRYATWRSLRKYCELSGGSVAIATSCVLGLTNPDARAPLIDLGVAVRLTQILRNLHHDLAADRIYLPLEDLARARVSQRALLDKAHHENFPKLIERQVERARELFDKGLAALPSLGSDRARISVATLVTLHRRILDSIARRGYHVPRRPIALTMPQKLCALPIAWRIAKTSRSRSC